MLWKRNRRSCPRQLRRRNQDRISGDQVTQEEGPPNMIHTLQAGEMSPNDYSPVKTGETRSPPRKLCGALQPGAILPQDCNGRTPLDSAPNSGPPATRFELTACTVMYVNK